MSAIYNEIEPFTAQWVRNLISAGHIATGEVDERSIKDPGPSDVAGPGQRHFFAGIGGWSYALRLAGIPDDADVWTGSCPCQPFSSAGKRAGIDDTRHLWPDWFALIRQCRPAVIFGEQVASPDGLNWFDIVSSDLEGQGYAVTAADIGAASVGAPHIRQRLYFVAHTDTARLGEFWIARLSKDSDSQRGNDVNGCGSADIVADAKGDRWLQGEQNSSRRSQGTRAKGEPRRATQCGESGVLSAWRSCQWLQCSDGASRPIEPGTFPLAHGVPNRVGRLRGYGNAIVPQVAATFITAAVQAIGGRP